MRTKILTSIVIFLLSYSQIISQELNGPTSWETIGNTFSQPNVHIQIGKNKLEWYGSGDVNNDEVITQADLDEMNNGVKNDMGDVDGDGTSSTSNDKVILQNYLNGSIDYLPGHWNYLTTKVEKVDWLEKMIKINDAINYGGPGWYCRNYIKQMEIDFYGISNIDKFIQEQIEMGEVEYHKEDNAKFNIPLQYFSTVTTSGVYHSVSGTLVGDNPLNFNDWYFVGYENDHQVQPGDLAMSGEDYARMKKNAYVEDPLFHNKYYTFNESMLNFEIKNNEGVLKDYRSVLLLQNPNDFTVDLEDPSDTNVNYQANLNVSPNVTGTPNVVVSNGLESILNYSDGDHYNINATYPNIEYSFNREWVDSATSADGVTRTDTEVQRINVSDTENPTGTVPADIVLTKEEVTANGGLTTSITGAVTEVADNSQLSVEVTVNYVLVSENTDQKVYNANHSLEDKFGNIANLSPQKVTIVNATISLDELTEIIINAQLNQDLTPEALELQGYNALPQVTVANTSTGYTLNYFDSDTTYFSTNYPWADREFIRTFVASLNPGEGSDTLSYKVKVKDLEMPTVENLESITITKDESLYPSVTGYPIITDNVAVQDTIITYALISESTTEKTYNSFANVTDVFGNDTTYNFQEVTVDLVTGLDSDEVLPNKFVLYQNYPNPFNPTTTVTYTVPQQSQTGLSVLQKNVPQTILSANPNTKQNQIISQTARPKKLAGVVQSANVSLVVYDILGKKVATLVNEIKSAGRYSVNFNANNLPSGVYLYKLRSGEFVETKQMLLVK